MTKLLICLYIIGSFYFHLKYIMYMTNNVLGYARSDRDGRNGLQENSNRPLTFHFSACLAWDLFL